MKRTSKTPKAIHVDFRYDVQGKAESGGVALYGDANHIGRCQQSSETSCAHFWTVGAQVCGSNPFSLRE